MFNNRGVLVDKKLLSLLLVGLVVGQSAHALTRVQVAERSAVGASVLSAGMYWYLCFPLSSDRESWLGLKWPMKNNGTDDEWKYNEDAQTPLVGGAATFVGSYAFFAWIASKYTASARYKWVNKKFRMLESKYLYNIAITDENLEEVLKVSGCEANELPLVAAFIEVQRCDVQLTSMSRELDKAIKDGGSKLRKKLKKQKEKVQVEFLRIRDNESIIKNHDKSLWLEQWKIHQKREIERERIRQQAMQTHMVWHI